MTTATDVLGDAFSRTHDAIAELVSGLSVDELLWRPDAEANHVAWLVWHLTRVQDDHLADLGGVDQVWATGWSERLALPYAPEDTGWSQTPDQVGAFTLEDPGLLVGYHAAVHEQALTLLKRETEESLERVVDTAWDPPVTAAVRFVSVVDDLAQHVGQAAYVRGLLLRRRR
jgi:hypothetical protein